MQNEINGLKVAADIGNGFSKVAINGKKMSLQPSLVAKINQSLEHTGISMSDEKILALLPLSLDVTIQDSLTMPGRYLIGKAAQNNHFGQMGFNVNALADKAHSDISILMTLGIICMNVLQHYQNKAIPSQLNVDIDYLVTDLPLVEATNKDHVNTLIKKYTDQVHVVTINNFKNPVTLHIHINKASVVSEGIIGNIALAYDPKTGKVRSSKFYKEFIEEYNLKSFNGADILNIGNIVGIDIGDGTVDISVVGKNMKILMNESQYIDSGIGNAIDKAIKLLRQDKGISLNSRQVFLEQANENNNRGNYLTNLLNEQLPFIEQQIDDKIKTIFTDLNGEVALIYFHGAGANTLKTDYSSKLKRLLKSIDPFDLTKVLWLPQSTSQWLNLEGLNFQLANIK